MGTQHTAIDGLGVGSRVEPRGIPQCLQSARGRVVPDSAALMGHTSALMTRKVAGHICAGGRGSGIGLKIHWGEGRVWADVG